VGPAFPRHRFGDFPVDCVGRQDLLELCLADIARGVTRARLVMDANGHALSLARTDPAYRAAVAQADLVHADGGFLVSLSRRLGGPAIPERSATTDMIHDFALRFQAEGRSFFLLGGTEDVNRRCAEALVARYPGLRIAGRRNGFWEPGEEEAVIAGINAARPDVVWMGLGKPKEQVVAVAWRDRLATSWIVTCGGCFNFVTGDYRRAPGWMQRANLEWVHRLATRPRQLLWRYLVTTPHALWIALTDREALP
jgi:exopolysaccharide biosynthesis WecB/TagA/CpsF family protein